jgi:hypothetical protein
MAEIEITQEYGDLGRDTLRQVERKLIIGSLALGAALLAMLGLISRI